MSDSSSPLLYRGTLSASEEPLGAFSQTQEVDVPRSTDNYSLHSVHPCSPDLRRGLTADMDAEPVDGLGGRLGYVLGAVVMLGAAAIAGIFSVLRTR